MSKVKRPIKLSASSAPSVTDDVSAGFSPGWQWCKLSTGDLWVCTDATLGAAVWAPITAAGGAVTSVNTRSGAVVLNATDIPTFIAAGGSAAGGAVPNPGATVDISKFLCSDATFRSPISAMFSLIDWGTLNTTTPAGSSTGHYTLGCEFYLTKIVSVIGAKFYWPSATNRTITLELWEAGAVIKTVDVTTSGIGNYTGVFSSPYVPAAGDLYKQLKMTMWDTINSASMIYSAITDAEAGTRKGVIVNTPIWPGLVVDSYSLFIANHAHPTSVSASERYLIEPVVVP